MEVAVSSSHVVSTAPSSSGEDSSLFPCSSVGSLTRERVLYKLLQVPSVGCSPSGTDCSSVGYSLHGATGPARSLLQRGLPTGSQPPSGIPLLRRGVIPRLQVEICSPVDLPGLQGDSLPHRGLHHHGLQGNLRSGAWSTSCPPSALTWGSAGLGLSHVLTPFTTAAQVFLPFLKYVSTEVLPKSLMGSALGSSGTILDLAGTGFV